MKIFETLALLGALAFAPQTTRSVHRFIPAASGGGGGTITVVQSKAFIISSGSGTMTFDSPVAAGDVVIVELFNQTCGTMTGTITDNHGNALAVQAGSPQTTNGGPPSTGTCLYEFSYVVPSGGATGLVSSGTGSFASAIAHDVAGLSSPTMQAYSGDAYSAGNMDPLPTATPTATPSVAIGVFITNSSYTPSAGAGCVAGDTDTSQGYTMWDETCLATGLSSVSAPIGGLEDGPGPNAFINLF